MREFLNNVKNILGLGILIGLLMGVVNIFAFLWVKFMFYFAEMINLM